MAEGDDARYHELIAGLFSGEPPDWVPESDRERFRLASDGYQVGVCSVLGNDFPLSHYYCDAHAGAGYLEGLCAALTGAPEDKSLFGKKVAQAAIAWSSSSNLVGAHDLFRFERLWNAPSDDTDAFAGAALAFGHEGKATVADFSTDVLAFTRVLDNLKRHHAPREIVARYAPVARAQRIVFFGSDKARRAEETEEHSSEQQ